MGARDPFGSGRDLLCEGLDAIRFDVFVPEGGYFATTDIRPLGYDDGVEFGRLLPELAGVVAIPHQVFYVHKDVIDEVVRRLGVLRR